MMPMHDHDGHKLLLHVFVHACIWLGMQNYPCEQDSKFWMNRIEATIEKSLKK